ncbi:hypothetical protein WJX73_005354 [Symbiochloris irregularis]|uniref:Uncharacterized protein n=1 Tax=Symbiochloris irregularis TaxID=706552 RepID=A0AAW1NYJ4_9CHLO
MLLALDLRLEQGLGPFTLGMPLAEAVARIRERKQDFRCVEVKYADQDFMEQDILLNLPEHGMHLRFQAHSQRLRLIEIYDISRMEVRCGSGVMGGASHAATFVRVYDLCGPTYPGEYDSASNLYLLHYPGLLVLFPVPAQHAVHCQMRSGELPLEFPDGTTPVASRFCIFAGSDVVPSAAAVAAAAPPPLPPGSFYGEHVEASCGQGLYFKSGGQMIKFGDSAQDVWSELGVPSGACLKPLDAVGLSQGVKNGRGGNKEAAFADYFYNYNSRGLDILFCGHTHRVKKFVLRTNVPGHPLFNMYTKCNFTLHPNSPPLASFAVQCSPRSPLMADESLLGAAVPPADAAQAPESVSGATPSENNPADYTRLGSPAPSASSLSMNGSSSANNLARGSMQPSPLHNEGLIQQAVNSPAAFLAPTSHPLTPQQPSLQAPHDAPLTSTRNNTHSRAQCNNTHPQSNSLDTAAAATNQQNGGTAVAVQSQGDDEGGVWGWNLPGSFLGDFAATTTQAMNALGLTESPRTTGDRLFPAPTSESSSTHHNLFGLAVIGPPGKDRPAGESAGMTQREGMSQHDSAKGNATGAAQVARVDESAAADLLQEGGFDPDAADGWNDGWNDDLEDPLADFTPLNTDPSNPLDTADHSPTIGHARKQHPGSSNSNQMGGNAITADSLWEDVRGIMGDGGRASVHSRGGAVGSPFGPTFVHGYCGVAFEVCRNGHLASVTLFEA